MRQIFLDTETTGLSPAGGDRILNLACVEMISRKLTNKDFHCYINPERESHEDALRVHGLTTELQANVDYSVFEVGTERGIKIEHARGMSCACTTGQIIVRERFASLNELDENEEDLLDRAWGLEPNSRFSCQAFVAQKDLVVEIPRYTINHAKENH